MGFGKNPIFLWQENEENIFKRMAGTNELHDWIKISPRTFIFFDLFFYQGIGQYKWHNVIKILSFPLSPLFVVLDISPFFFLLPYAISINPFAAHDRVSRLQTSYHFLDAISAPYLKANRILLSRGGLTKVLTVKRDAVSGGQFAAI